MQNTFSIIRMKICIQKTATTALQMPMHAITKVAQAPTHFSIQRTSERERVT